MPRAIDQEALDSPNLRVLDINNPPTKQIQFAEFPKMVYLHPKDKTKEHKWLIVHGKDEQAAALARGYRLNPHIPVADVAAEMRAMAEEFEVPEEPETEEETEETEEPEETEHPDEPLVALSMKKKLGRPRKVHA